MDKNRLIIEVRAILDHNVQLALKKTGKDCEKLGILIANMGIDYKFNIQFDKEFIDQRTIHE